MHHLADLGTVFFDVRAEQGEFPEYDFRLTTTNNEVLLKDIQRELGRHDPPLTLRTVNDVPAAARPDNETLAIDFKDGDRLQLVAEIAPGDSACWQ